MHRELVTGAIARRILWEGQIRKGHADEQHDDTARGGARGGRRGRPRAVGVECVDGSTGDLLRLVAHREVILAAGPIASPHLLQLSGVGDASLLSQVACPCPYP